jgi:hypothetical protein
MAEEQVPSGIEDDDAEGIAVQVGIEAIKRMHAIERAMLTRAVNALSQITSNPPEEVIAILSSGLDEEYERATKQAVASAEVAKLHLPQNQPTWRA